MTALQCNSLCSICSGRDLVGHVALDLGFGTTLLCPGGTNTIVWWEKYHRLVSIAQELAGLRSKKKWGDLHEVFNGSSTEVQR